jgi:signal transduction histidine kinase
VLPVEDIKLEELIEDLIENLNHADIKTDFNYSIENESLSDDLKLNIYRIIQEQINNILKYSEAKRVTISLTANNDIIHIETEDNGKGFNIKNKKNGIGISNMRNRIESYNGRIVIKSTLGKGCRINAFIPL